MNGSARTQSLTHSLTAYLIGRILHRRAIGKLDLSIWARMEVDVQNRTATFADTHTMETTANGCCVETEKNGYAWHWQQSNGTYR